MIPKHVKSIPYGLTDYERVVTDNYYYVDKTHFIPRIEQAASFFLLIRPRRFGKSLLLNMLDSYYDINNAERFETLFGNQWIYQNETDLRAKFLVMRFNFSMVDSRPGNLQASFEDHCKMRFMEFILRYKRFFPNNFEAEVMKCPTAASRLQYID